MNTVTDIKASHATIAMALATAQMKMGKALKGASNTHFKNKYADLSSVVDACMPALNECGIAVIQPTTDDESGRYVETILIHGESGQELKCRVPLIVSKNDMQGYGSAVTYARRYGLMSMAGIAPEDDDGNAASKAPPKAAPSTITPDQLEEIESAAKKVGLAVPVICTAENINALHYLPASKFDSVMNNLRANAKKAGITL